MVDAVGQVVVGAAEQRVVDPPSCHVLGAEGVADGDEHLVLVDQGRAGIVDHAVVPDDADVACRGREAGQRVGQRLVAVDLVARHPADKVRRRADLGVQPGRRGHQRRGGGVLFGEGQACRCRDGGPCAMVVARDTDRFSSSRRANDSSANRNGGCAGSSGMASAFWCAQSRVLLTMFTTAVISFGLGVDAVERGAVTFGDTAAGLDAASVPAVANTATFFGTCGNVAGSVDVSVVVEVLVVVVLVVLGVDFSVADFLAVPFEGVFFLRGVDVVAAAGSSGLVRSRSRPPGPPRSRCPLMPCQRRLRQTSRSSRSCRCCRSCRRPRVPRSTTSTATNRPRRPKPRPGL